MTISRHAGILSKPVVRRYFCMRFRGADTHLAPAADAMKREIAPREGEVTSVEYVRRRRSCPSACNRAAGIFLPIRNVNPCISSGERRTGSGNAHTVRRNTAGRRGRRRNCRFVFCTGSDTHGPVVRKSHPYQSYDRGVPMRSGQKKSTIWRNRQPWQTRKSRSASV